MHPSPPRAGRDYAGTADCHVIGISIHPPRAGRDPNRCIKWQTRCHFNPPAPCGAGLHCDSHNGQASHNFNPPAPCGAGRLCWLKSISKSSFQSTRPVRGGTWGMYCPSPRSRYFNPPAPCGAGLQAIADLRIVINFNPPAPCGAGHPIMIQSADDLDFNPPAPCGAGRNGKNKLPRLRSISIHPPRAGRDGAI